MADGRSGHDLTASQLKYQGGVSPMTITTNSQYFLSLLLVCVEALCHGRLLLMAGVESNPGPITMDDTRENREKILAELCINAPTKDVRDTIRLYD